MLRVLFPFVLWVTSTAVVDGQTDPHSSPNYLRLRAAIHIHTTYSTGDESLRDIAEQARERGIDVLVVTDDDLLRVSFGL
ncbi:MAG: hypothetical protein VYD18_11785, partial [Candidatus Latescibacterota bacterium]|nr:hypothetical protein [Candidatus Latescibacterota bacterium]